MLISVQVKQILDGKVVLDDTIGFNSVEQFRDNLKLTYQKWENMHGKQCVIRTYSDAIVPGCCFYGIATDSDDLERWEIVEIDTSENTSEKKKPNLIIDVEHVMYSSEPRGTCDEYSIVDSNTMNVYARTFDKDIAEIILNTLKEKFAV